MAWFYATPVFYPAEIIPDRFRFLLHFNPMYALLESLRVPIYRGTAPALGLLITGLVISLLTLTIGWTIFHRLESRFIHYV